MHILTTGNKNHKFFCGTRLLVLPFVGINNSGGTVRLGVGLFSPKSKMTLAFQSLPEDSRDARRALLAMTILDNVHWVDQSKLSLCIRLSAGSGVNEEMVTDLTEIIYPDADTDFVLVSAFRFWDREQDVPHVQAKIDQYMHREVK
jgi:hypothetical protein